MTKPSPPASPQPHPTFQTGKVGVLVVNLGTPEKADAPAVKRYLREFLSDSRVVDYPRAFWLPVLHGIILNTRPRKTAALYKSIWRSESDESPLRYYTRAQAQGVATEIGHVAMIDWAMRYGVPSIKDRLCALQSSGCDRILIVPLYPQYSATTTATVVDEVGRVLRAMTWQPSIRMAPPFHDAHGYIDALEQSVRAHLPNDTEKVILSYHGIPQRYFDAGDPYHCHCQKTSRLLRERMGWDENFAPLAFQSKFGPEKWLEPSTENLVKKFSEQGIKRIAVLAPAFVSDCIETLEEISIGLKETFTEHGGEKLTAIPCLNDDRAFISFLTAHIKQELGGWVSFSAPPTRE